jgi:hypothetical protein
MSKYLGSAAIVLLLAGPSSAADSYDTAALKIIFNKASVLCGGTIGRYGHNPDIQAACSIEDDFFDPCLSG